MRRPTLGPVRNFGGAGELGVVSADVLKNAERRHVELEMVAPAPAARRGVTYSHTNLLNGFDYVEAICVDCSKPRRATGAKKRG